MITTLLKLWNQSKWRKPTERQDEWLCTATRATFQTAHGQEVLQDWLDRYYCTTVPPGANKNEIIEFEAKRAFIHEEILQRIDRAEFPEKYRINQEEQRPYGMARRLTG